MFLHVFTIIAILQCLSGKPTVVRNVSNCSITEEGILHYHGQHSYTKFDSECLPWHNLQTDYADIINKPNFFNDESIEIAKNYCRNPNMNLNGPWCFVQHEGLILMEQCDVCQSLTPQLIFTNDIGSINGILTDETKSLFQQFQDEIKRHTAYLRDKLKKIVQNIQTRFKNIIP